MSSLIEVQSLSKNFGAKKALNNVSFQIEKGAPVALVGPNGAGKTTLFSILCGYLKASTGTVSILGNKPGHPSTFGKLAALPQDALLDPRFSIAHQLKFYAKLQGKNNKEARYEVDRTLTLVGLSDVINEKPTALSHGMRKRVAIAQALIGKPEIVMLDEATAGLDPKYARDVRELVASLSDETTFILSSHDLSELERLCQHVLYIENGVLQEHQTINENDKLQYLTLRMECQYPGFEVVLSKLSAVKLVENTQDKEYLITSENDLGGQPTDMSILQVCHQNSWRYRQIINGKTLENQLF